MQLRHRILASATAATLAAGPAVLALAPSANAAAPKPTSLASILLADTKNGAPTFDKKGTDFDILTAAVLGVLKAKPKSPVSVLTKANVKLTAFLPTDNAFERTAKAALGITAEREARVANRLVAKLGVSGVEKVLLYHVVAGQRITSKMAAASDGAHLKTALGQSFAVDVRKGGIFLIDKVPSVRNPKVVAVDINKAPQNPQIAHVINRVLLPAL
jgi:uncharacterized surface protein with fasciclin (FAS1) repeats